MTIKQAIARLQNLKSMEEFDLCTFIGVWYEGIKDDYDQALDMAIEALTHFNSTSNSIKIELSCSEMPNRSDLISRQMAIDALGDQLDYLQMLNKDENPTAESKWYGVNWARNTIADLPSAQPDNFLEFLWNVINPNEMQGYLEMYWSGEEKTNG